jgi:phosphoglycolate phosphatase
LQKHGAAVLFDIDGVLVNTAENLVVAYESACREQELEFAEQSFRLLIGLPIREIIAALNPQANEDQFVDTFKRVSSEKVSLIAPYKGVLELINFCANAFSYSACVTSKDQKRSIQTLEVCGLPPLRVFSPDLGFKPKPAPDLVKAAIEESNCERAIFLGDAKTDYEAACNASADFIFCSWGYGEFRKSGLSIAESPEDAITLLKTYLR